MMTNLEVLRSETRALHDRLERNPMLARLMEPDLSLAEYRALVLRMLGFYEPLEEALKAQAGGLEIDVAVRAKTPLLRRDLQALSPDHSGGVPPLSRCSDLPRVDTEAGALGCLYVLEGATLGGKLISRHLRRILALDGSNGAAFYNSYGDRVGEMWKGLCRQLDAYPAGPPAQAAMAVSACDTFEKLDRWLFQ